jgi:hypothetical protein
MLDAALAKEARQPLRFSIDTVPTSVGRPVFCCSRMSLTMASNFSRDVR